MRRLVTRTVRRAITREELWNGNRERVTSMFRRAPRVNILRWSWTQHTAYADRCAGASRDPANAHLRFVRVTSDADASRLITVAGAGRDR